MDRASQRAVLEQLTMLDEMAAQAGAALPPSVARTQVRRITRGWRELLAAHQPTNRGRCPVCSGWLLRRKWPCRVWMAAHQQLIGDPYDSEPPETPVRAATRRRREVEVVARRAGDHSDENDQPEPADLPVPSMRTEPQTGQPQLGPNGSRIHRAAVIERRPTVPGARLARHPRS
ncbi:MAG: hypothetical protein GEV09_18400 [Pseudonocardiaceae bacterium]|nr:hypothetical protein [Pseudonocardiaceae bacterium]